MAEELIARVLITAVSIFALMALLRWPYQHLRKDRFRDELFEIRSELFRSAARGEIAFGHPAYGILRQTINGFIRFGADGTPLRMLVLALNRSLRRDGSYDEEWREAIGGLSPEARARLISLRSKVHRAVSWHLVLSSPVLLIISLPALVVLAIAAASAAGVKYWLRSRARVLLTEADSEALKIGGRHARTV